MYIRVSFFFSFLDMCNTFVMVQTQVTCFASLFAHGDRFIFQLPVQVKLRRAVMDSGEGLILNPGPKE